MAVPPRFVIPRFVIVVVIDVRATTKRTKPYLGAIVSFDEGRTSNAIGVCSIRTIIVVFLTFNTEIRFPSM